MRSVDGGETWEDCSDPLEKLAERPNLKEPRSRATAKPRACSTPTRCS